MPQAGRPPPLLVPRERSKSIQLASQTDISSGDVGAIFGNAARARKSLVEVSMFSALSNVDHWLCLLLAVRVTGAPSPLACLLPS